MQRYTVQRDVTESQFYATGIVILRLCNFLSNNINQTSCKIGSKL